MLWKLVLEHFDTLMTNNQNLNHQNHQNQLLNLNLSPPTHNNLTSYPHSTHPSSLLSSLLLVE